MGTYYELEALPGFKVEFFTFPGTPDFSTVLPRIAACNGSTRIFWQIALMWSLIAQRVAGWSTSRLLRLVARREQLAVEMGADPCTAETPLWEVYGRKRAIRGQRRDPAKTIL
jgi:hypothetical protein